MFGLWQVELNPISHIPETTPATSFQLRPATSFRRRSTGSSHEGKNLHPIHHSRAGGNDVEVVLCENEMSGLPEWCFFPLNSRMRGNDAVLLWRTRMATRMVHSVTAEETWFIFNPTN